MVVGYLRQFVDQVRSACLAVLLCAQFLALAPTNVLADYIPPGTLTVQTVAYRAQPIREQLGTYHYDVKWQGIPVGHCAVTVDESYLSGVRHLEVEATASTNSAIDIFYRLRHTSESLFRADSFAPIRYVMDQTQNRKQQTREIVFGPNGEIRSIDLKRSRKGVEETRDEIVFFSSNQTLDPISAAFVAKSLAVSIGTQTSFDVFNGKHRYLVGFEVLGQEQLRLGNSLVSAFKVRPSVKKLTDSEGERRLREATLWISTDGTNRILKLDSKVLVGRITAQLDRFEPAQQPGAPTPTEATPTGPVHQARLDPPLS